MTNRETYLEELKGQLQYIKTYFESEIQERLDFLNKQGFEVDLLICTQNIDRIGGVIEQLAIVDISVKVKS